jgi:hypothetical protein
MGEVANTLDLAVEKLSSEEAEGQKVGERVLRLVRPTNQIELTVIKGEQATVCELDGEAILGELSDDSVPSAIIDSAKLVARAIYKDPFWRSAMRANGGILEEPQVAPYYRSSN